MVRLALSRPFARLLSPLLLSLPLFAQTRPVVQANVTSVEEAGYNDPQWASIQQHLPNPELASARDLEMQADLLRVRRYPKDALQFYGYAIKRGGTTPALFNKMGLTQLELRNVVLAQGYFREALRLDKRNAQAWNNLAATEYVQRQYGAAVSGYRKAVKLDNRCAVFHANLGTAYFETKDYKRARKEADDAMMLDPLVFQHGSGSGIAAHILSVEDKARFSYEMARVYAEHGQEEETLHALAVACENGFDILKNMAKDPSLVKYVADPRVTLFVMNAKALHGGGTVLASAAPGRPDASTPR